MGRSSVENLKELNIQALAAVTMIRHHRFLSRGPAVKTTTSSI
jgi:hypothetical protein